MNSTSMEQVAKKLNLKYCKQHNHVYDDKCVLCENGIEVYNKWGIPSTIDLKEEYELFFDKVCNYSKIFTKPIKNNTKLSFVYKNNIPNTSLYYWRALKINKNIMVAPLSDNVNGIVILIDKVPVITFVNKYNYIHLEIISNKIFLFDSEYDLCKSISKYLECEDFPEVKDLLNYIVYFCNNKYREHNNQEKNIVMDLIRKVVL